MPSEMVERVARGIWEAYRRNGGTQALEWDDLRGSLSYIRERCLVEARAAIEAMRVPTEAILGPLMTAAYRAVEGADCLRLYDDIPSAWSAAIDAALSEEEGGDNA